MTMLIIKIALLLGSVIGAPTWDLVSDYMAADTLEYLISVPHLISVPADKFLKIPVRLLDP